MAALDGGHKPVPAERDPVRDIEGGAADHLSVDHSRGDVAIHLIARTLTTVLKHPLDVHP